MQRAAEVDGFVTATLPPNWRLGEATAGVAPLYDGLAVALQRDGLFLDDERLVAVSDGQLERSAIDEHLILPLNERVQLLVPALKVEHGDGFGHVILYVDPDMLVTDLIDVIYTLGRNEFYSYQFAVAAKDGGPIGFGLDVSPPIPSKAAPPVQLIVILGAVGVQVGRKADGQAIDWMPVLGWDQQPMSQLDDLATEFAHAHRNLEPEQRSATFTAHPELPIARLFEAMNATAGRECTYADLWKFEGANPRRCHFAERILEASAAPPTAKREQLVVDESNEASDRRSLIRAMVRSHLPEVTDCYNLGLTRDPKLAGRIETRFVVEPDGRISQAEIIESTLNDPNVENCLLEQIDGWKLEGLGNEGKVVITYPFNFTPAEP